MCLFILRNFVGRAKRPELIQLNVMEFSNNGWWRVISTLAEFSTVMCFHYRAISSKMKLFMISLIHFICYPNLFTNTIKGDWNKNMSAKIQRRRWKCHLSSMILYSLDGLPTLYVRLDYWVINHGGVKDDVIIQTYCSLCALKVQLKGLLHPWNGLY